MSKREKIILGLTALAILYGGFTFLFPSTKKTVSLTTQKSADELNRFVSSVSKGLRQDQPSKIDADILARAATEWPRNPFVASITPLRAELRVEKRPEYKAPPVLKVDLAYTGYLVVGNKKLAIINGMEYEVGDELEESGYILSAISPTKATIREKKSNQQYSLTLEEKLTAI